MTDRLTLAVPSKGRLMEQALDLFKDAGIAIHKSGHVRGYRGEIDSLETVDVAFVSASEIAWQLKVGRAHLGITGEDLVREQMADAEERVDFVKALGFGHADVVVAVPQCWLDVHTVADLDEMSSSFRAAHGRWLRVATKYINLSRRFFGGKGVNDYRLVESLGATEGTPAAGTADLIVDITTTGETLKANGLKILDDGVILNSQATFLASKAAEWSPRVREAQNQIMQALKV